MIGKTSVVIDSASYLPAAVIERFGAIVVPLTVVLDGHEYREFEDIDAASFYTRLAAGAKVSTSQPPPGRFLDAYSRARELGAEQVVSIHIGSGLSGTVNSARVAAEVAGIPVHVLDTGQASFIEGLCAWEAMDVLAAGGSIAAAEAAVRRVSEQAGNVFIVRGTELLARGGRYAEGEVAGVPVLALVDGAIRPIGSASDTEQALAAIVGHVTSKAGTNQGDLMRIGVANGAAEELAGMLEARLRKALPGAEIMQYTIGPVVGAHTGPGCTGAVFLPRGRAR